MSLAEIVKTLEDLKRYKETHKLQSYAPYPYQKAFHHASAGETYQSPFEDLEPEIIPRYRAIVSANKIGKTWSAAMETAMHATGLYPEWWKGIRFDHAVKVVVAGITNESTKDNPQKELFGDPNDEDAFGTGSVPKDLIVKTVRKAGVPNAYSAVIVKHISGKNSVIKLMATEQGPAPFMGDQWDVGWLDEEPPQEVLSQLKRGTLAKDKFTIYLTLTPEQGMTDVVLGFIQELKPNEALIRATWDDAPHMTPERREEALGDYPPHEREMRSKGEPLMGSGLVFTVKDEDIMCDPIPIPDHWARIAGMDFGSDHPAACAWIAWDRDSDTVYLYDIFKKSRSLISEQASTIKKRGAWIPIAWPHDGMKEDPKSGKSFYKLYIDEGLTNFLPKHFSNPPGPGQKDGGQGVEIGITELINRMETGRFKVFSHLKEWFDEKRIYHRKDGKIVKLRDDLMSATRYAVMSLRFAKTNVVRTPVSYYEGVTNW